MVVFENLYSFAVVGHLHLAVEDHSCGPREVDVGVGVCIVVVSELHHKVATTCSEVEAAHGGLECVAGGDGRSGGSCATSECFA